MSEMEKLARDMADRGVPRVFGIPGSGASLVLLDALERRGVPFVLTHFEGTGALMAGAAARLSGRAGAAISIKGPGLANMVPGLAACRFDAMPVVSLSEAYLPGTPLEKAHKRMDHEGLLSAVAKGRRYISGTGPGFDEMASWAEAEAPGPVHLEIAESGVAEEAPVPDAEPLQPSPQALKRAVDLVEAAERPLVVVGTLALRRGLSARLNGISVPVFTTAAAKGAVDETLPQAAGVYTGAGRERSPEYTLLNRADAVICIGLRHQEVLGARPFACRSLNVDPLGSEACSGFGFHGLVPDTDDALDAVFAALREKSWGLDEVASCMRTVRSALLRGGFLPAHAFRVIEDHLGPKARLVLDTGNFCTVGEHVWRVPEPGLYVAAGQGRYMGAGMPLALGAALHDPSVPTVAVLGDGGVGMFLSEIKIAVRHGLPLLTVLMSDAGFGSVRARAVRDGLSRAPVTVSQPSWLKAFEGLGVASVKARSESELLQGLGRWDPTAGPMYIEIPFDPEAYGAMVEGVR